MPTQNITRASRFVRDHFERITQSLDAIEQAIDELGIDPADVSSISHVLSFRYAEPKELQQLDDATRRTAALQWLAMHARIIKRAGQILGCERVQKYAEFGEFGVRVWDTPGYFLDASVPDSLTCELVDTGETEVVPAVPEQVRPIFEKRCPESIFAGVQDEIEVAA